MNKLLLLIFTTALFLLTTHCLSQTSVYKPFPEVYGKWIVKRTAWGAPSCGASSTNWKQYEAMGDTTVGAYSYKKVYVASNTGYPPMSSNVPPFGPNTFSFGYRNDIPNKKVYYLDCTGGLNKDTLMFDFNLTVGSPLPKTYAFYHWGSSSNRFVTSIDSLEICGTYYKRFNFDCGSVAGTFPTALIEGQGFMDRFFDTDFEGCPFEPCVTHETEFFSCFNTNIKKENAGELNITIYPNPASKELNIDAPKLYIKEISIFDVNGKCVMITDKTTTIDVSKLNRGIYFIKVKTDKGEFSQKFMKE